MTMHSGAAVPNVWKAHPRAAEGSVPQKQLTAHGRLTERTLTVILSPGQGAGCDGLKPLVPLKMPYETAAAEPVEQSSPLLICMQVQRVRLHRATNLSPWPKRKCGITTSIHQEFTSWVGQ